MTSEAAAAPLAGRTGGKGRPVRVLIVDDSASMRRLIRLALEEVPEIEIVAEAGTARQARDAVNAHAPDVMTLDVEMPGMDGIEFLRRLMRARPMPVVMISSLTRAGSEAAVRALSLGAVDCIAKPRFGSAAATFGSLGETVRMAARARLRAGPRRAPAEPLYPRAGNFDWNGKMALIGASTGGVEALETVLSGFPENCPPTLITQHMPAQFLTSFANRLAASCAPEIRLAKDGDRPRQGLVLIAPGGDVHMVLSTAQKNLLALRHAPKRSGHRPSVDELFLSAVPCAADVVAVILTGMGHDGAEGMRALHCNGAQCLAQDRSSSVVYGMPRVAVDMGGVHASVALEEMARAILDLCGRSERPER
jgi:two-component system chemotaxis response regulator CheB